MNVYFRNNESKRELQYMPKVIQVFMANSRCPYCRIFQGLLIFLVVVRADETFPPCQFSLLHHNLVSHVPQTNDAALTIVPVYGYAFLMIVKILSVDDWNALSNGSVVCSLNECVIYDDDPLYANDDVPGTEIVCHETENESV